MCDHTAFAVSFCDNTASCPFQEVSVIQKVSELKHKKGLVVSVIFKFIKAF